MARRHEIPTHLDVEDKLFAGLTPRQLLLLCLGVGLGYSLWQRWHQALMLPLALLLALLPALVSIVFATIRPDDRPLEHWLLTVARYATLAQAYVAGRGPQDTLDANGLPDALAAVEAEWRAIQEAAGASTPARMTDEWGLTPPAAADAPDGPDAPRAGPSVVEVPGGQRLTNG